MPLLITPQVNRPALIPGLNQASKWAFAIVVSALMVLSSSGVTPALAAPLTGGTGPGGFELTNGTTSLKSWLDASDDSTRFSDNGITPAGNGAPVYLWKDKSGYNNNATATSTSTQRPTYNATALSGNSAIRFDPTGGVGVDADGMTINPALNITTQPFSVFILDQYYGGTQGRSLQSSQPVRNWLIGKWNGLNGFYSEGWVTNPSAVNTAGTNVPAIGVGRVGTTAGSSSYFINGVDATNTNTPNTPPGTLGLGAGGTYAELSNADVSEIIIYTRQLNTAERRIVENYLSSKYNVGTTTVGIGNRTLGVNDLYSGDLNTNGNFDHEVFGVGRTDASNQLLNAGAGGFGIQVTGGVAANELNDGEFILAGHNNAIPALVDLNPIPGFGGARWSRIWNVDTNGGSTDATFGFNFDDAELGAYFEPGATYHLLYSDDQAFATYQDLGLAYTIDGNNTISFDLTSDLLINGYFTLGMNIAFTPEPNSLLVMLGLLGCGMLRRRTQAAASQME